MANRALAWGIGLCGAAAIVWSLAGPRSTADRAPPPGYEPLEVVPLEPSVGAPDEKKVEDMLDAVEAAEAERLGPEEAARRRTRRETILPRRFDDDHAD